MIVQGMAHPDMGDFQMTNQPANANTGASSDTSKMQHPVSAAASWTCRSWRQCWRWPAGLSFGSLPYRDEPSLERSSLKRREPYVVHRSDDCQACRPIYMS